MQHAESIVIWKPGIIFKIAAVNNSSRYIVLYKETTQNHKDNKATSERQLKVVNSIDLAALSYGQKEKVREVIKEKRIAFSQDGIDVGDVPELLMKVKLKDEILVQQSYNTISKQLDSEIKHYIEDLLKNQWIIYSCSEYPSLVVAVRKKDHNPHQKLNGKVILNECTPLCSSLYGWSNFLIDGVFYTMLGPSFNILSIFW